MGTANFGIDPDYDTNPDLVGAGISVAAGHRRRGVGSRLLAELIKAVKAEGRTRIVGGTNERVPAGHAFATAIGAEAKQAAHVNRLLISDVDRAPVTEVSG